MVSCFHGVCWEPVLCTEPIFVRSPRLGEEYSLLTGLGRSYKCTKFMRVVVIQLRLRQEECLSERSIA
jgi:hypothetical protein